MPHLILSVGRTGTAWLASCLGWDHEPQVFSEAAVSPRHLHLLAKREWTMPRDTKVAVITRDPQAQVLSVVNRWRALGNFGARKVVWLKMLPRYIEKLDELVIAGAGVMNYDSMVHCHRCLLSQLQAAGMPSAPRFDTSRRNAFPKAVVELDSTMERAAGKLRAAYRRWHDPTG